MAAIEVSSTGMDLPRRRHSSAAHGFQGRHLGPVTPTFWKIVACSLFAPGTRVLDLRIVRAMFFGGLTLVERISVSP